MQSNPVYLVNELLKKAILSKATDIHFHPSDNSVTVKTRVNGKLLTDIVISIEEYPSVVNRLKVLSNLSSSNALKTQDGRLSFTIDDNQRDLRISVIPSHFGENIVIRILSKSADVPTIDKLGMNEELIEKTKLLLSKKEGMILTTGPTGSGKTTTLYSLLKHLYTENDTLHVVSIEDPIEYIVPAFTQIQVNEPVGMNFSHVLRSVLRHDPDVILIGEIRDQETAQIAIRAAMTGHLVFATLHTNTAKSAIARFIDFEIREILIKEALLAVYNQRLIKENSARTASFELFIPSENLS
ncbi:MAG: ATPase, T2SS/T4P/T4SS family [Candidatus Margulisbacteria bacterium]|nr:ATPase, T2SS/T4P/T4SS family [Candidatus Margulisiibacteriota bacterium]